jgi:hypothetical protein
MWHMHVNDYMYDSHLMVHGKLELNFIDFRVFFTYVRLGDIGDDLDS